MKLIEIIRAINTGKIKIEQIANAKGELENEIAACVEVIQDKETEFHIREEYKTKLIVYTKLFNKI
jgi:hypothetical protein